MDFFGVMCIENDRDAYEYMSRCDDADEYIIEYRIPSYISDLFDEDVDQANLELERYYEEMDAVDDAAAEEIERRETINEKIIHLKYNEETEAFEVVEYA